MLVFFLIIQCITVVIDSHTTDADSRKQSTSRPTPSLSIYASFVESKSARLLRLYDGRHQRGYALILDKDKFMILSKYFAYIIRGRHFAT